MKTIFASAAVVAAGAAPNVVIPTFSEFLARFGKSYEGTELSVREAIYANNVRSGRRSSYADDRRLLLPARRLPLPPRQVATIREHNAGDHSWWMGVNKFADLTVDEFRVATGQVGKARKGLPKATRVADTEEVIRALPGGVLPASVDWRETKGMVLPVKDQGQCGSCWAFATTFAVESAHALLTNGSDLISLSEQQVVSCDNVDGNDGCECGRAGMGEAATAPARARTGPGRGA
jgi:hypothetical protein